MIVESGSGTAGLIVDEVDEVITVDDEQLEQPPAGERLHRRAVAKVGDRLLVLLDPSDLRRRGALDAAGSPPYVAVARRPTPRRVRAVVCDDSPFMRRFLVRRARARRHRGRRQPPRRAPRRSPSARAAAGRADARPRRCPADGHRGAARAAGRRPGVIVVSAHTAEGSALALDALALGAVESCRKPASATPLEPLRRRAARPSRRRRARRGEPPRRRPAAPARRPPPAPPCAAPARAARRRRSRSS